MAGRESFVCRGKDCHILPYNIPDGETVQSFAEKTSCKNVVRRSSRTMNFTNSFFQTILEQNDVNSLPSQSVQTL